MGNPSDLSSSWLTVNGQVINPDAPAGGGGAGSFRTTAGTLGVNDPFLPALPSPDAPAARYVDPAIPLDVDPKPPAEKINPPPTVNTSTTNILLRQDDPYDIDVDLVVLPEKVDPGLGDGGDTEFSSDEITASFPPTKTDGANKITEFVGKFTFKGRMTIQVMYESTDEKKGKSAYGRGTTPDDIKNGDVTVGFHESCHVTDFQTFIKNNPLPVPTISVGMSPKNYQAEQATFKTKYARWNADILAYSNTQTDEVGNPTKSQFLAQKKGKK